MPRKSRRSRPAPALQAIRGINPAVRLSYLMAGLLCAVLGSGVTYLALRPQLTQVSADRSVAALAAREQGNRLEDQGQWAEAITAYQSAIANGLDTPDLRTDLGVAYFKSSQPQKALEQYVLAQKQNPAHENSLFNEASAYAVLGDSKQAIAIWQTYLQKFPHGQHVADAKNFIATVQAHRLTPEPLDKP